MRWLHDWTGALILVAVSWCVAIAGVACNGGCTPARQVVVTQVNNLRGCDANDARAIVVASAEIVRAAAEAKAGGDKVVSMLKVIEQLAIINRHWQHCKATAGQSASLSPAGFVSAVPFESRASPTDEIDIESLAELLATEL